MSSGWQGLDESAVAAAARDLLKFGQPPWRAIAAMLATAAGGALLPGNASRR